MENTKDFKNFLVWSLVIFSVWTVVAFAFTMKHYFWFLEYGSEKPFSLSNTFTIQFISCLGWVALTPLIFASARQFLPEGKAFYRRLFFLALTGFGIILLQTAYQGLVLPALGYMAKFEFNSYPEAFRGMFVSNWLLSFSLYAMTMGIVLVSEYYKKFRERELRNSRLEANLIQAKLRSLKMQLHPHFLFNTHNAISELIYKDPDAAEKMIATLSDLLRITLENSEVEEVTLERELSFVKKYVEIERMRFQERLKFDVEVSSDAYDSIVPNMILQPLVENAIKHGITPKREGGSVHIDAFRKNNRLHIEVSDDGIGLSEAAEDSLADGIGLRNVKERLFYLYRDEQDFKVSTQEGEGFTVAIEIPFKNNPTEETALDLLEGGYAG